MGWDERYRRGEHLDLAPLDFIAHAAPRLAPGCALDLASGPGRHARLLWELGWSVTAVDSSAVALSHLPAGIAAVCADLEKHEFDIEPEAWDLICVCYYLQRDLFPEIRAAVRKGGRVMAAIPLPGTINPAYTMPPGELRALFQDWEVEHYAESRAAELIARKPP